MNPFVVTLVAPLLLLGACATGPAGSHSGHHMQGAAAEQTTNCPMAGQGSGQMMQGGMMGGAQPGAQGQMQGGVMGSGQQGAQGPMMQDGMMGSSANCPMAQQQAAPAAPAPAPDTPPPADPHRH